MKIMKKSKHYETYDYFYPAIHFDETGDIWSHTTKEQHDCGLEAMGHLQNIFNDNVRIKS